jgi:hypothetical protein
LKFGYLILTLGFVCAAACAPEARPDEYGKAMPGAGGSQAGAGGAASGGKGGTGGGLAMVLGGSGGSMPVAGMGGIASTGGAAGAAMQGGAAGMNMGGAVMATGGTPPPPPPPPGPTEKPSAPVLFGGTNNAVSKVVPGDATPGYFYAGSPSNPNASVTVQMLSAADQTGLPAGVIYAQQTSNTADASGNALVILGFNFRANDALKWRWIDSSDFPGFTFWARVSKGSVTDINVTTVDATNILATDPVAGKCAAAPCLWVHGKLAMPTATWAQYKYKWTDFTIDPVAVPQGPVDSKQLGRIDLLMVVTAGTTVDFQVTAVKLATAAELQ